MISDKVSTTTGMLEKFTGFLGKLTEWITPFITFRNIVIVAVIWFLVWYWVKGNEERFNNHKIKLPYR